MSIDTATRGLDLSGQVALVTGGGRGLGRAFALALASAGAHVVVTARTATPLAETVKMVEHSGGRAVAVTGDVVEPGAVARVVSIAEAQLGPVDILVNNAGVVGPIGHDWGVDHQDWWSSFDINVRGPFLCARGVLPGMLKRGRGRIVNISSGAGFNRHPQMSAYSAAKAALTQWTKCLAEDTRAHGISVFAFHPGVVRTPMLAGLTGSPNVPREVGVHCSTTHWRCAGRSRERAGGTNCRAAECARLMQDSSPKESKLMLFTNAMLEKVAAALGAKVGGLLERDMRLTIPTWLAFVFLGTASFAPVVSVRPAWWAPYYGALLACWVMVSVAAKRSVAREDRKAKRKLARVLRQVQDTKNAEAAETGGDAVRRAIAEARLIIVARDEDLYDYIRRGHFGIRRGQFGDETVRVITDRRSTARRRQTKVHITDRRVGERRCYDIEPLLVAQGWAEATLPKRSGSVTEGPP